MPVDPGVGERLAVQVADLYAAVQLTLLRRIALRLVKGESDGGVWLVQRLGELDALRRSVAGDVRALDAAVAQAVPSVIAQAYGSGQALAMSDLGATGARAVPSPARSRAIELLAAETLGVLRPMTSRILRSTVDLYQRAAAQAAAETLAGGLTRRQASQGIVTDLARRGLSSFTDRRGRRWSIDTYAEMATRTATGRASVDGHVDQLGVLGVTLVQISDSPRECALCRPWEGAVLSTDGTPAGRLELPSVTTGRPVSVRVDGTLEEARAAGLQHPNCRHQASAYLPGATRPLVPTAEPEGYKAQQQQRALERRIRAAKLEQAVAVTPEATATASRRVRAAQAALRDHLAANPELKRQRAREQVSG